MPINGNNANFQQYGTYRLWTSKCNILLVITHVKRPQDNCKSANETKFLCVQKCLLLLILFSLLNQQLTQTAKVEVIQRLDCFHCRRQAA